MTIRTIATAVLTLTVLAVATPAEAQFGIAGFVRALENHGPGNDDREAINELIGGRTRPKPTKAAPAGRRSAMPIGSAIGRVAPMVPAVGCASDLVGRARTATDNARSGQVENAHRLS